MRDSRAARILSVSLDVRQLRSACAQGLRRQAGNLSALSLMLKKPSLLRLWLTTARRAQLVLGVAIVALTFLGPPTATRLSEILYPTRFEDQGFFQRLMDTRTPLPNPLRETRRNQFLFAAWLLGIGTVIVVLLGHVPGAVAIGRQRAVKLTAKAEKIAALDPEASARLRRTAEELLIDDDLTRDALAADRKAQESSSSTMLISRSAPRTESTRFIGTDRRYRLDRALGSGGMGVVHAGTDTVLQRPIALKQLFSHLVGNTEQSSRFRQEALALARLTHPNIVTIHDLVEFEGHFWIVMELLTGGSLADRIADNGSMTPAESIDITCEVAVGLGYAHERGIVHRDVKPMNVLFTADGKPKLTDFGNAKLHESAVHTSEGHLLGSPAFMSPEQITGAAIDLRTDLYSLGVSLYQMLTGRVPFEGELSGILAQHVSRKPDPPGRSVSVIPPGIDAAVLKMLEKAPEDRFQSCRELVAALRTASKSLRTRRRA